MDLSRYCCVCGEARETIYKGDAYCAIHEQERYRIEDAQGRIPDQLSEVPAFRRIWDAKDLEESQWDTILDALFGSRFTEDLGMKLMAVRWKLEGSRKVRDICEMTGVARKTLWTWTKILETSGMGALIRRCCGRAVPAPGATSSDGIPES